MGRARESLGQTSRSFSSTEHSAARFAAQGLGAVVPAAQDELQLEVADRAAAERQKAIEGAINAQQLAQTLVEIERTAAAKRVQINAEASKAYADLDRQRLETEKKSYLDSTGAFLDQLQKRLDLRKQLEERTTGLVEAGQISDPLADADK